MRKKAVKAILFSLSSLAAISAQARALPNGLHFIEELPIEQRVIVHEEVRQYLYQHPVAAAEGNVFAIDEEGIVYALDQKLAGLEGGGAPSTTGRSVRD